MYLKYKLRSSDLLQLATIRGIRMDVLSHRYLPAQCSKNIAFRLYAFLKHASPEVHCRGWLSLDQLMSLIRDNHKLVSNTIELLTDVDFREVSGS